MVAEGDKQGGQAAPRGSGDAGRGSGAKPDDKQPDQLRRACLQPADIGRKVVQLGPLPARMSSAPCGLDERGEPIRHVRGSSIVASVRQMQEYLAVRAEKKLPAGLSAGERAARIEAARSDGLRELLDRVNRAVPDGRWKLDAQQLLRETLFWSHEFNLYLNDAAKEICGDPDFYYHRGLRSIPASMVHLFKPFSLRRGFLLTAHFTAKASQSDVRAVETTSTSAVIQWHPERQLAVLPDGLHRHYVRMACPAYQGTYAAVPPMHSGLPVAEVRERQCVLDGASCCEWEFRWEPASRISRYPLWAGGAAGAVLLACIALQVPGWTWLAGLGALVPPLLGWAYVRMSTLRRERETSERLLFEQRDSADEQYDVLQRANAELQFANSRLQGKIAELTTLQEIGLASRTTLALDEMIARSLQAVATHLHLDGATLLLVDPGGNTLVGGGAVGASEELARELSSLRWPLDDDSSLFVRVVRSGKPLLTAARGGSLAALGRADACLVGDWPFLAVPLTTKGATVGLLVVDNHVTGRPIEENLEELLLTAGADLAAAVDNARLVKALGDRAEHAIRESEQRLANIFGFLPDPTFAIDRDGRVTAWNRAMAALTGVEGEAILGKGDHAHALAIYGDRRPILADAALLSEPEQRRLYPEMAKRGEAICSEIHLPRFRGREWFLSATAAPLFDSRGERIGAIETIRDITDRHKAKRELELARDAAEAASRAKSTFLANMSHELRTPLNAVLGYSEMLQELAQETGQEAFVADLAKIHGAGQHLLGLIGDILDLSKIEAGKMELQVEEFDLDALLGEAASTIRPLLDKNGNRLELRCSKPLGRVCTDAGKVRQVLLNLLSNAGKFTHNGTVTIEAERMPVGNGGGEQIGVVVRDTGIGIAAEQIPLLFQPFTQADASATRKYGGTGLGLAISKRLCQMLKGEIGLESEQGRGSAFTVRIPARLECPRGNSEGRTSGANHAGGSEE